MIFQTSKIIRMTYEFHFIIFSIFQ